MRKAGVMEYEIRKAEQEFEELLDKNRQEKIEQEKLKNEEDPGNQSQNGKNEEENPKIAEAEEAGDQSRRSQASQRSQKSSKSQQSEALLPIPEGFEEIIIPNALKTSDADEETDFLQGVDRPNELQAFNPGVKLIGKINWSFSFQQREEKSEAYYANLADRQELERQKEKKKIPNIIRTLGKLRKNKDLLNNTMNVLCLVLASESCNKTEGMEALDTHQLFVNMPTLLKAFRSIFIEFREVELPVTATIALLKSCLYMKIISKNAAPKFLKMFQENFHAAGIFPFIVDIFEKQHKESKLLSTKILNFVTFMIYDLGRLYFDNISGVRLDALIGYVNHSQSSKKDSDIVTCHSKLVNACCHCLFEWKRHGTSSKEANSDQAKKFALEEKLVKSDLKRLAQNIFDSIKHLIGGGINTQYK